MQGGKSRGSASISAVVVFMSALLVLGMLATLYPNVASFFSAARAGLQEGAERASELIRIYIHTLDETEYEPPIITIINGHERESVLTDYVVVARDGRVLAAGKMGNSLDGIRLPPGGKIDLRPQDFGLSYATFASMADEVKAIYIRTAEGNSFGSSYGPPPKINPDYQLSIRQNTMNVLVIGRTVTQYNYTILGNFTIPTTGNATIVKNVILVDWNGKVSGGAIAGNKWCDGSFDLNKIPDALAALTRDVDIVPIGSYYVVRDFPVSSFNVFGCEHIRVCTQSDSGSQHCWIAGVHCYDARPAYIEMIEFYPEEYYTPSSPVTATAYWLRYEIIQAYVRTLSTIRRVGYISYILTTETIRHQHPITLKYPVRVPSYDIETARINYQLITYTKTFADLDNMLIHGPMPLEINRRTTTVTAFATVPVNLREQVKQAVVNRSLSGDMYIHLSGTVQGNQLIKIKAPIVLLNYIYIIPPPPTVSAPPLTPPPSSDGGGGDGAPMVCEVISYVTGSSGSGSSSSDSSSGSSSSSSDATSSSSSSSGQSLISGTTGSPKPDYVVREQEVTVIKKVVCVPV